MKTRVVNKYREPFDVYIGRGGPWGNRYVIGKDGTREEVIAKHRADTLANPALKARIRRELAGKALGCFCKPKACHGDVYAEIVNEKLGEIP